jgi:hypothetical protein
MELVVAVVGLGTMVLFIRLLRRGLVIPCDQTLVRIRGRVVGPGSPGEQIKLGWFDLQVGGERRRVLARDLPRDLRRIRVGAALVVEGVQALAARPEALYREPSCTSTVDAMRITRAGVPWGWWVFGVSLVVLFASIVTLCVEISERAIHGGGGLPDYGAPDIAYDATRSLTAYDVRCPPGSSRRSAPGRSFATLVWMHWCEDAAGIQEGPWVMRSLAGWPLVEGQMRRGLRAGVWRKREREGETEAWTYRNNVLHGPWWRREGEQRSDGEFLYEQRHGRWRARSGERTAFEATYRHGVLEGASLVSMESSSGRGWIEAEGEHVDGQRSGRWTFRGREPGELYELSVEYRAGEKDGPAKFAGPGVLHLGRFERGRFAYDREYVTYQPSEAVPRWIAAWSSRIPPWRETPRWVTP